jgi:hypothetical protein
MFTIGDATTVAPKVLTVPQHVGSLLAIDPRSDGKRKCLIVLVDPSHPTERRLVSWCDRNTYDSQLPPRATGNVNQVNDDLSQHLQR